MTEIRLVVGSIPTRGNETFFYIYIFISSLWLQAKNAALSSATHHAMPSEFGEKLGTECLNIKFPLSTTQCAGYSVKLIRFFDLFYRATFYPLMKIEECHKFDIYVFLWHCSFQMNVSILIYFLFLKC